MNQPDSTTLPALLAEVATEWSEQPVLIDENRTITYTELRDRTNVIAGGLADLGIGAGDRVAILMENRIEWIETMFAAMRLGAMVVGISTWAEPRDLEYYLSQSETTAVVATSSFVGTNYTERLEAVVEADLSLNNSVNSTDFPALETIISLEAVETEAATFSDLTDGDPLDSDNDPNDADDTALLLYSSGSTSQPKGIPLLHDGIVKNSYHIGERMHLGPDDRFWLASPLFWSYGSANALGAMLTHGASVVLQAPFDPDVAVDLIAEYECTVYYGMPNMARAMVSTDGFDVDRLSFRTGTTIGQVDDVAFTMDKLGIPELCNVYGSTETYGNCAVTDSHLSRETRLHTQGEPLPGQEAIITDTETGERVGQGKIGEIRIGGRISPAYYNDPERTAEAYDDKGYLKTGDLGQLDEEGRIQYRGRLKNVIKTGGINVSAVEIEEFLLDHPDIEQAYIIGLDDDEKGELVAAVVVPGRDSDIDEDEIRVYCEDLSSYKRPAQIAITSMENLPVTDTGKTKRAPMADLFE